MQFAVRAVPWLYIQGKGKGRFFQKLGVGGPWCFENATWRLPIFGVCCIFINKFSGGPSFIPPNLPPMCIYGPYAHPKCILVQFINRWRDRSIITSCDDHFTIYKTGTFFIETALLFMDKANCSWESSFFLNLPYSTRAIKM